MTLICHYSFLDVYYDSPYLKLSYCGNMGASKQSVDDCLTNCGLPSLGILEQYPSFSEEGSPDYIYKASIIFSNLPSITRRSIGRIICERCLKNNKPQESIDAKLQEAARLKEYIQIIDECLK